MQDKEEKMKSHYPRPFARGTACYTTYPIQELGDVLGSGKTSVRECKVIKDDGGKYIRVKFQNGYQDHHVMRCTLFKKYSYRKMKKILQNHYYSQYNDDVAEFVKSLKAKKHQ
jgi:hypothetical protein